MHITQKQEYEDEKNGISKYNKDASTMWLFFPLNGTPYAIDSHKATSMKSIAKNTPDMFVLLRDQFHYDGYPSTELYIKNLNGKSKKFRL